MKLVTYACLLASAWCHGLVSEPLPRNTKKSTNYCEHCLSGGGLGAVYANGRSWPNGVYGLCGDPPDNRKHEGGGGFEKDNGGYRITTYRQGSTITISLDMRVVHGGYNEYRVCPVPDGVEGLEERKHVTEACLDKTVLQRADGKGTRTYFDPKLEIRDHGSTIIKMAYKLPANLVCKRCVLQWMWVTGNSCTPPNTPDQFKIARDLSICGQNGANPEQFWNCADITIVGSNDKVPSPVNGNGTTVKTGTSDDVADGGGGESTSTTGGSTSNTQSKKNVDDLQFPTTSVVYGAIAGSVTAMPLVLMGGVLAGTLGGYVVCFFVMLYFMNTPPKKDSFQKKFR